MPTIRLTLEGRRYLESVIESGAKTDDVEESLEWLVLAQLLLDRSLDVELIHMQLRDSKVRPSSRIPQDPSSIQRAVWNLYNDGLIDLREEGRGEL